MATGRRAAAARAADDRRAAVHWVPDTSAEVTACGVASDGVDWDVTEFFDTLAPEVRCPACAAARASSPE